MALNRNTFLVQKFCYKNINTKNRFEDKSLVTLELRQHFCWDKSYGVPLNH